ncbi:MAG: hypothetical protein BRC43_15235 [Cyanobacteria bacterium QS_3_48_167]|nr:MAG: hypothetical protein BRC43_15235 [Cyanobacteria bacterium QS_3_48_167]
MLKAKVNVTPFAICLLPLLSLLPFVRGDLGLPLSFRIMVVMHGNDSGGKRGMVVVDQVPNRAEMITQLFGKRK